VSETVKTTHAPAEAEIDQLSRRVRPALLAYFLRRVRSHADAEDLTQDVFLRLADLDKTDLRSADAYVFRMAANLLADRARRQNVRNRFASEITSVEGGGVDGLCPYRIAAGRRSLAVLAERLNDLPERTRNIFVLYRIENVNKRAIADALGVTTRTVEIHVARAMAHLMLFREDGE
jgi:RNA polymerase sigma-70 factor (ECF subfamily)